jgi:hypothetical protein
VNIEVHSQGISSTLGDKVHPWGPKFAPRGEAKNGPLPISQKGLFWPISRTLRATEMVHTFYSNGAVIIESFGFLPSKISMNLLLPTFLLRGQKDLGSRAAREKSK